MSPLVHPFPLSGGCGLSTFLAILAVRCAHRESREFKRRELNVLKWRELRELREF